MGIVHNLSRIESIHHVPLLQASELEWMVSEEECSQALLPMPDSIAVAPDEVEKGIATRIRGNLEWAPPRYPSPYDDEYRIDNCRCRHHYLDFQGLLYTIL